VAFDPFAEAFGEVVVDEVFFEVSGLAIDCWDWVGVSGEADVWGLEESHDVSGGHGVFEPFASEDIFAATVVGDGGVVFGGFSGVPVGDDGFDFCSEFWGHAFVGVEVEDPLVFEVDVFHGPVLVVSSAVVGAGEPSCAGGLGDFFCSVCGEGIEDDDVVTEGDGFEKAWEVVFFVECLDEDGDGHGVASGLVSCEMSIW